MKASLQKSQIAIHNLKQIQNLNDHDV